MLKRYEFLGLIALALAGSASFALAGNEGTTLDAIVKHIDAALTGSPLSQEELSSILDKAIATQQQFDSLSAVFRASYYENIERMSPESLKLFPNLVYNNGNMTGTLYWWRDGALERLDSKFDIPKKFMQQQYEDHIAFKDSEKQISYLCRTHQGAILGPGSLHAHSPADWLFPGSRRGIRAFREEERFQLQGFTGLKDDFILNITMEGKPIIDMTLSPVLDFAVTGWTQGEGGAGRGSISYDRDKEGRIIPREVVTELRDSDGLLIRSSSLTTLSLDIGAPDPEQLSFTFPAKSLVLDNRTELYDGKPRAFEVDEGGQLEEVPTYAMGGPTSATTTNSRKNGIGGGMISLSIVAAVLCIRACSAWMVQARRKR